MVFLKSDATQWNAGTLAGIAESSLPKLHPSGFWQTAATGGSTRIA